MFLDEIRRGDKQQTIRLHRCKYCSVIGVNGFKHVRTRHWIGKEVKLYTGMRRKGQKAELLGVGVVTSVVLKRFGNLTELDAELDGFKRGFQSVCRKLQCGGYGFEIDGCMYEAEHCSPLNKLHKFLRRNYKAKPDTLFEIISWKLIKGGEA